jgi:tRNA(Arg) A34 adenosine deaminase TadA
MAPHLSITLPEWALELADWRRRYDSLEERMRLAIALSRENVVRSAGGPFGAAVFRADGTLVSVGVNSVVRLSNSVLHAETVALMFAEQRAGSYTLRGGHLPEHELVSSCDPCAMCLGAVFWSGVRRLVCGAAREDAMRLHFDEGPVFPESYDYLGGRGIQVVRGVLRGEATEIFDLYGASGGEIYGR